MKDGWKEEVRDEREKDEGGGREIGGWGSRMTGREEKEEAGEERQ